MSIFNRTITGTPTAELRHLTSLYKMVGLTPPTPYAEVRELIASAPDPHQVVNEYAQRAYETDNPAKLIKEAKTAIADAMAGDELRKRFLAIESATLARNLGAMKAQFREDATDIFNKDIAKLKGAADLLDRDNPLDAETAVAQDNGQALTTARTIIPRLAAYSSLWTAGGPDVPPALKALCPILEVPTLVVEQVERTLTENPATLNTDDARGTLTVRRLGEDAREDMDRTIIGIVRGEYEDISFDISTPTADVTNAYKRESIEPKRLRFM